MKWAVIIYLVKLQNINISFYNIPKQSTFYADSTPRCSDKYGKFHIKFDSLNSEMRKESNKHPEISLHFF